MPKNKIDIQKKVMSLVHKGKLNMKPRWYFVLGSLAIAVGLTGLIILSIFAMNLMVFSLRTHGPMGTARLAQLLTSFPWWALLIAIGGIGINIRLIKRYDFSYKKNLWLVVIGFVLAVLAAGWLIDYTGLDNAWAKRGPLKKFYQRYHGGSTIQPGPGWHR